MNSVRYTKSEATGLGMYTAYIPKKFALEGQWMDLISALGLQLSILIGLILHLSHHYFIYELLYVIKKFSGVRPMSFMRSFSFCVIYVECTSMSLYSVAEIRTSRYGG
jgi:hypothetical protein